ncbi:MAG: PBP1A family penicillin-binding protein [Selenomonadaceae bacterium]|nr:PBP1A family penicillin-binding protein [Selenomonadaceae bacterium]
MDSRRDRRATEDAAISSANQRNKKPPSTFTFKRVIIGVVILSLMAGIGVGIGFLTASMNTKADLSQDILPPVSSQIYDSAGNELANIHATENRLPVKIEQVPVNLQHAFIAIEDNRFYEHNGVDPRGLLRAAWSNINDREISEGGSTITQQLAKNAYLTQERTMQRKVQEMFLAMKLEKQYTKQEILELYLNQIYFGQGAYGVQAAARTYFGKDVEQLDLSECALLAGIPKSPNYYSPFNDVQAAKSRRNVVLDQMVKYGYIGRMESQDAKNEELKLAQPAQLTDKREAAYFIDYVTQLLIDKYGADAVYKEGLKVYTTIDMDMQHKAEAAVAGNLPDYGTDANGVMQPQAALVAIDPTTGFIKAMVGGRGSDQFNRATLAERQPGSAFKPFVFAAALENGFTPDTVIEDSPITINGWSPQNDSRRFSGPVTMRTVATFSMNVPTVKIAQKITMDKAIYYAQEMGITTFVLDGEQNDRNFATSLGGMTKGVTPLELTSAYGTFANKGLYVPHTAITKVLDRNGKILEQAEPQAKIVLTEESAADLTSMLEDVIIKGTGKRAAIGRPAAGKTGTTSNYHDAWFVGYTPDLVAGVWVGNDNNTSLDGIMGGQTPAAIWSSFMQNALADVPAHDFDNLVVTRRKSKTINELRDEGGGERSDRSLKGRKSSSDGGATTNRSSGESPQQGNTQQPLQPQSHDDSQTSSQSEVNTYSEPVRSEPQSEREPEPTYTEPEPPYREPEPTYTEPEPAPVSSDYSDVPTPGGGAVKGR